MARNRRNKRSSRGIIEVMSSKTFINLTIILAIIILILGIFESSYLGSIQQGILNMMSK